MVFSFCLDSCRTWLCIIHNLICIKIFILFNFVNFMPEKFLQNIKPREYQKKIFESCSKKNCLVVIPTGLGKTLIALMLAIDRLKKFPLNKVLFLAPTKPLAEQHLNYFKKHLPELFAHLELFTGKVKASERKKRWQNSEIIFSTPQCIANDLKKNLYDLKDICLLIEDEAHRCLKNYDYNFIAQEYKKQSKNKRILGLTASPGHEKDKINNICKNLSIEDVELRTRDSEDVKPFLQELEFEKVLVDFPLEFEEIRHMLKKLFNMYVEELKTRGILYGPLTKTNLINLQKKISSSLARGNKNYNYMLGASACAQAIKLNHALELLETQTLLGFNKYLKKLFKEAEKRQSKGVVRLVSKPEFNFIFMASNELLSKGKEHPKIKKLMEIILDEKSKNRDLKVIIFTKFRETASIISKEINKIKGIKSKIFIGQAKKNQKISENEKVKKEISGLTQKEQKYLIEKFSSGEINVLCATSIAEEGLDIPEVNMVIFYEPVASAIRTIQRRGRTARLMQGKLVVLITKKTSDESFFHVSKIRERKMNSAINDIKNNLSTNQYKNNKKIETQKKLE